MIFNDSNLVEDVLVMHELCTNSRLTNNLTRIKHCCLMSRLLESDSECT